jgi:hypothetical protein
MPQMGFEPMIPVFKRAKTVHALDHAATAIGSYCFVSIKIILLVKKCRNQWFIVHRQDGRVSVICPAIRPQYLFYLKVKTYEVPRLDALNIISKPL